MIYLERALILFLTLSLLVPSIGYFIALVLAWEAKARKDEERESRMDRIADLCRNWVLVTMIVLLFVSVVYRLLNRHP